MVEKTCSEKRCAEGLKATAFFQPTGEEMTIKNNIGRKAGAGLTRVLAIAAMLPTLLAPTVTLAADAPSEAERYIIKFHDGSNPKRAEARKGPPSFAQKRAQLDGAGPLQRIENRGQLRAAGVRVKQDLPQRNAMAAILSAQELRELKGNPNIKRIEVDEKRYMLSQSTPFGIEMVEAHLLSDAGATNLTACIIDSGFEYAHEDLSANNVTGDSDPGGAGDWFTDENGHGTHVGGTIAAVNNDRGVVGVLPNGKLRLHIVKVFNAEGWAYSSSLINAMDNCVTAGAAVINMSLGANTYVQTEADAFQAAYDAGVLPIAAAGNDGNTAYSYPASYPAVVSVAAIDANKNLASFSQQNDQVELAGPGVAVRSTMPMGTGYSTALSVGSTGYDALAMDGSASGLASGNLVDCGLADAVCTGVTDAVCLIQRGGSTFASKIQNCEAGGAVGAIIYNNEAGPLAGTISGTPTQIISVGVSDTAGAGLLQQLGETAELSIGQSNYGELSGTSMATPHVVGVAALVWSHHQSCGADVIRSALAATAEDLGAAGRDNGFGYGLVKAKAAVDAINADCSLNVEPPPPPGDDAYVLDNGTPLSGLVSTTYGEERHYKIDVPAGASNLRILTTGGSGDVDLYVKVGAKASFDVWDYRPYRNGNEEVVEVAAPAADTWYIMLRTYAAYDGVTLAASFDGNGGPPANIAPSAAFGQSVDALSVTFIDQSQDVDGTITGWQWDFGDGATSTTQNPAHTYASAGDYSVTLTVTDDAGATDSSTQTVTVSDAPPPVNQAPTAAFDFLVTGLSASFSNESSDSDGTVTGWQWQFGDGATSAAQNPSHTYTAAGTYSVTLTVTDNDGASSSATQSVTVEATAPPVGNTLENGVAVGGMSGAAGEGFRFTFEVPANATNVTFETFGGTGDVDLYVKFGSAPGKYDYDAKSVLFGSAESISEDNTQPGQWHVWVVGYYAFADASVVATHNGVSGGENPAFYINGTDMNIPDGDPSGITSVISVDREGPTGLVSVAVDIKHPYRGDIELRLISPSGSTHILKETGFDGADDILETYQVNVGNGDSAGDWQLQVIDLFSADQGYLDSWSLEFY